MVAPNRPDFKNFIIEHQGYSHDGTYLRLDGTKGDQEYIDFNTSWAGTMQEGRLSWNADDGTLQIGMAGGVVNQQIGEEIFLPRGKAIGSNIDNGQLVYLSGASGSKPELTLAKADSSSTSKSTVAMATENISQNANGYYTAFGLVRDIPVPTGTYSDGDILYLSAATAGAFTNVSPVSPNKVIKIGYVMRAHNTEGIIFVDIHQRSNAAKHIELTDVGGYYTGTEVETALQEIGDGTTLDGRYYTQTELNSNTIGSSGASLIGLNSEDATAPTVQQAIDGMNSSQYYNGGIITENAALNGTIDITECVVYIKRQADNEAIDMTAATVSAATGEALSSGLNFVCVDYNSGTPIFSIVTVEPNHSTVLVVGRVYKDANNHVHILQAGQNFLGMPWKTHKRFTAQFGLTRTSGLITTEATEDLGLDISSGSLWQGVQEFDQTAFDGDEVFDITGGGTGGTISANNTIVFDSGEGDVTGDFKHGQHIVIDNSSNGNDGCYHFESASWDGTNTTIEIEEATLNTGADTGHVHPNTFLYWHYDFSTTSWVSENQAGDKCAIIIDVNYWNDIDNATEFKSFTSNRYGTAWVYKSADDDVHVVYGQGNYTLAQAAEMGAPATLPDIINKMCFLIAKIIFQEGDTSFYEIYYPWTTTFNATGASDHGGLAGLSDDDHTQYALLTGRVGGQTIYGDTDADGTLTLYGSSGGGTPKIILAQNVELLGDLDSSDSTFNWTVVDNTAAAFAVGSIGATDIWEIDTTNAAEGINVGGYLTSTGIITGAVVHCNTDLYLNYNGPDGDSNLYFYEGSSTTGGYLRWDDSASKFVLNKNIWLTGDINSFGGGTTDVQFVLEGGADTAIFKWDDGSERFDFDHDIYVVGPVITTNNLYLRNAGPEGDNGIYFYEDSSQSGASLIWDDSESSFATSHSINVGGDLRANGDIYVNFDGPAGDGAIYFYDASPISHKFHWNEVDENFELSDSITINGSLTTTVNVIGLNLISNNNVYLNYDGVDADSFLYFYEGVSPTGRHLKWDNSNNRFEMNDTLYTTGLITAGSHDLNGHLDLDAEYEGYAANIYNVARGGNGLFIETVERDTIALYCEPEGNFAFSVANKAIICNSQVKMNSSCVIDNSLVVNEDSSSSGDFRWKSNLNTHGIFGDASTNRVGIFTSAPSLTLDVNGSMKVQASAIIDLACTINNDSNAAGDFTVKTQSVGQAIFVDASANTLIFNEGSQDLNIRVETNNNSNALFIDGGSDDIIFNENGYSGTDIRIEGDTQQYLTWWDASADKIYVGTTGVSADYYSATRFELFDTPTGNDKLSFTFNAALGTSLTGTSYQAVMGGKGISSGCAAGENLYGFFGEITDDGTSTGGNLYGVEGGAVAGTSQNAFAFISYCGVVANKTATTIIGIKLTNTYLQSGASLTNAYGLYAEKQTIATNNYTGYFGGRVKIADEELILPVVSSISGTPENGSMRIYHSGLTERIYVYVNGAWRYVNLTP